MVRSACRRLLSISLALLAVTAQAHVPHTDPDLSQARRLVSQSRQLVKDAHRRDPHGFGGHEAKAAELLRRASLQLSEARDFRIYNAGKPAQPPHRITRHAGRYLASHGARQRMS
ncbi:hypothetical protein [Burkholderia guangdongensis]|uniref:hypothetical protein n=1 Tax=Burkholderia guangdongensis TaxID=1792500 RepID=UPI0015C9B7D1|nr:hypothetical protein [Burkholderia guangdongensis]